MPPCPVTFAFPFLSPHCSLVKRSGFSSLVEYISTRIHSSRTETRTFPHPHVPIRHSMRHRNMRHMISAWTDERIRITISAQSQVIKGVLTPIVRLRYLYLRIIFPMEMFKKKPNGDGRKESRKFFFNMWFSTLSFCPFKFWKGAERSHVLNSLETPGI